MQFGHQEYELFILQAHQRWGIKQQLLANAYWSFGMYKLLEIDQLLMNLAFANLLMNCAFGSYVLLLNCLSEV